VARDKRRSSRSDCGDRGKFCVTLAFMSAKLNLEIRSRPACHLEPRVHASGGRGAFCLIVPLHDSLRSSFSLRRVAALESIRYSRSAARVAFEEAALLADATRSRNSSSCGRAPFLPSSRTDAGIARRLERERDREPARVTRLVTDRTCDIS